MSGFGQTLLEPSESTTFSIQMDADALGSFAGQVSFANDDEDENPFDFTVIGQRRFRPGSDQDNGDKGYQTVGSLEPLDRTRVPRRR